MKGITKENKGITLVALIITVILMLIFVSTATYSGINTYKRMQVTKFVAQMQLIQTKVDEISKSNETQLGNAISENQKSIINLAYANGEVQDNTEEYKSKYRYFSSENLESEFDISDIDDVVLINFETREVISINGVEYEGNRYYTQYKLPDGQTLINSSSSARNLGFNVETIVDGLNCNITINNITITNGTLSFAETDLEGNKSNLQTITNYTEKEKEYTVNITKSGNYVFKLEDNTDSNNYTEKPPIVITLTNKPRTNANIEAYNYGVDSNLWAYTEDLHGIKYIWIPRFVYKVNEDTDEVEEIKYIKGNSNIATDNTYINSDWIVHDKFSDDGNELTGIWIEIEPAYQSGLNMIELLDGNANTLTEINIE